MTVTDAAPAHLVDVAVFCDSDDTHTASVSDRAAIGFQHAAPPVPEMPNEQAAGGDKHNASKHGLHSRLCFLRFKAAQHTS